MAVVSLHNPELATAWHVGTQRRRVVLLAALAVVASLIYAVLVLALQFVSAVVLLVWMAVVAIAWRPLVGLCLAWGLVQLFEPGNADQIMVPGEWLHNGLTSTTGIPGLSVSPLELLLLFSLTVWLVQGTVRRRLDFRGGQLAWPMLLFAVALGLGYARGATNGGSTYLGFWELRPLLYFVCCYVLAANLVRSRRHVAILTSLSLLANGLFAIEGAYRRVALIDTGILGVIPEFMYGHEDVIFLGTLLMLVIVQQVFGTSRWQRLVGPAVALVAIFTLLASERRAGYIAVIVAFLVLGVVFLFSHRKAFFLIVVPILIGGAIYLPFFWNNTGMLGQPARAIRSLFDPDPRDAASNLSRELEKINIRATIAANPLLGVGFGKEYLLVVSIPDISFFPLWQHETHHNILWIWLKTGAYGFTLFWIVIGIAIARAAHYAKVIRDPQLRVFALLALGGIVAALVFSYVDLGLTSGRVNVFLGTAIGTLAVLDRLGIEPEGRG